MSMNMSIRMSIKRQCYVTNTVNAYYYRPDRVALDVCIQLLCKHFIQIGVRGGGRPERHIFSARVVGGGESGTEPASVRPCVHPAGALS